MSYTIRSNVQINVPPTSNVVAPFSGYDVKMVGGGYSRTLSIHSDGTMINSVDVYAAYIRSTVTGGYWRNLCTASSLPSSITSGFYSGGGVIGASMYAGNSSIILMGYTPYDGRFSTVLLSQDKGYTFNLVNFGQYSASPNGGNLGGGGTQPMLAIDPNNSSCAFVGSEGSGLFFTSNLLAGTPTWKPVNVTNFTNSVATTSQTLTPGIQTITIAGSFNYGNQGFILYETSNPSNYMNGYMNANGGSATLSVTGFGGSGSHSDWTLAVNCVSCICYDSTSGVNGSGFTNKVVVVVAGSGIWYTANGGTSWTGPLSGSTTTPGRAYMNTDGTYWASDTGNNKYDRLTSGNVFTALAANGTNYVVCADPVNPNRMVGDNYGNGFAGDGHVWMSNNALAGTPTFTSNGWSRMLSPAGQPQWIKNSNDQYLTAGQWIFDPLQTTSATSLAISGNSYTFTDVPLGLNIVVGDFMRASQATNFANFIMGVVTHYSAGNLTIVSNQATSTSSQTAGTTGNLTFSVPSGGSWVVGAQIHIGQTSQQYNFFSGFVVSYNAGSSSNNLVVNITDVNVDGSGAFTDWTIHQGEQGGSGTVANWVLQKERLWFAYGCGMLYTDMILSGAGPATTGAQFWNSDMLGIESLVISRVVWPPGYDPVTAGWDRPYWHLQNPNTPQANYHPLYGLLETPTPQNNVQFGSGINYAVGLPTFIIGTDAEFGGSYSTDSGETWTPLPSIPATYGNLATGEIGSVDGTKLFFMGGGAGGLYYSANLGTSWTEAFCSGVPPGPQRSLTSMAGGTGTKNFTLSPLYTTIGALSFSAGATVQILDSTQSLFMTGTVISYNSSTGVISINVTSSSGSSTFSNWTIYTSGIGWTPGGFQTFQVFLAPDRVTSTQFHVYNSNNQFVYKSTDGGQTFTKGTNAIPGAGASQLKAAAQCGASTNTTGHLFAANAQFNQNQYRSTDGGNTWTALSNVTFAWAFGFGAPNPAGSMTYPAVYMFGVVTGGAAGSQAAFYRSDDNCVTWNYICTYLPRDNLVAGLGGWVDDVQCMEGNPSRWNSFIVGYQGSGCAYWGPSSGY